MAEFEQDPSANTGRFRAFVEAQEQETRKQAGMPRGMLIGGIALAVIVIVVLAVTL